MAAKRPAEDVDHEPSMTQSSAKREKIELSSILCDPAGDNAVKVSPSVVNEQSISNKSNATKPPSGVPSSSGSNGAGVGATNPSEGQTKLMSKFRALRPILPKPDPTFSTAVHQSTTGAPTDLSKHSGISKAPPPLVSYSIPIPQPPATTPVVSGPSTTIKPKNSAENVEAEHENAQPTAAQAGQTNPTVHELVQQTRLEYRAGLKQEYQLRHTQRYQSLRARIQQKLGAFVALPFKDQAIIDLVNDILTENHARLTAEFRSQDIEHWAAIKGADMDKQLSDAQTTISKLEEAVQKRVDELADRKDGLQKLEQEVQKLEQGSAEAIERFEAERTKLLDEIKALKGSES